MTFLVFLVSVAVLEYILKRKNAGTGENTSIGTKSGKKRLIVPQITSATPDLRNLSTNLEQHGRGPTPEVLDPIESPLNTPGNPVSESTNSEFVRRV